MECAGVSVLLLELLTNILLQKLKCALKASHSNRLQSKQAAVQETER